MVKLFISPFLILSFTEYLLKAPSTQDLEQRKQSYLEKRKQIYLCQKQLEKNTIPESCYQISPLSENFRKYLDKKCEEIPLESIKLHKISNLLKNQKISSKCLKSLEEKEKILRYQQQDLPLKEFLKQKM